MWLKICLLFFYLVHRFIFFYRLYPLS
jgi:hypothetical protein